MIDLVSSLLGAGVSVTGAAFSWWRSSKAKWDNDVASLQNLQNKSIELSMRYPHLERISFCHTWPDPQGATQDDKDRYDNYCCFVFNMLAQAWEIAKKRKNKVPECVAVHEFVHQHHVWWNTEIQNFHYYDTSFIDYIASIINDLKKKGTIK